MQPSFRVSGLKVCGFRVEGLGFQALRLGVSGLKVWGVGFGGLGLRVEGLGGDLPFGV